MVASHPVWGVLGRGGNAAPRTRKTCRGSALGLGPQRERTTRPRKPCEGVGCASAQSAPPGLKVMVGTGVAARCPAARAGRVRGR